MSLERSLRSSARQLVARRHILAGLAALGSAIPIVARCASPARITSVADHRRPEDPDDTAAALRAIAAGDALYFPAGRGSAPDGAYVLRGAPLRSGMAVYGDGEGSVLRPTRDAMAVLTAISQDPAGVIEHLVIRDLRIEGLVTETGFREHFHLVTLSGVSDVRVERVAFIGFASDGLYLGAELGWPKREPRIIRNIVVRNCLFDGVNRDNRNGISATGGSNIAIQHCRFRRCTRANMPGPIDFEPDASAFYQLTDISVTDCEFDDCGGNVGQVGVVIPSVVTPPRGVTVARNRFRNYRGTGADVAVTINREPDPSMVSMDVTIENNDGSDGYGGVQILSGKGITIRGNRWTRYASRSFVGFPRPDAGVMDVLVSDSFDRCGQREGIALAIYKGENVRVEGSRFTGTGDGGPGSAPIYLGTGRLRRLRLRGNDFRGNPNSRGLIIVERGGDYVPVRGGVTGNLVPPGFQLPDL